MTTASLHREMVGALRAALRRAEDRCICGPPVDFTPDETGHASNCEASPLRAALEGWEKRPPLSQDEDAIELVRREAALSREGARHILDALEPLLFGERG